MAYWSFLGDLKAMVRLRNAKAQSRPGKGAARFVPMMHLSVVVRHRSGFARSEGVLHIANPRRPHWKFSADGSMGRCLAGVSRQAGIRPALVE